MDINPSSDVLIVKEIEADEKTSGGLIVPHQVRERDSLIKAEVLAAGPGRYTQGGKLVPNEYKVGDTVVFDKMRGLPVTYGGQYYLFVNAHQVFGSVNQSVIN